MDKPRELRRSSMAASNGLSRRRQRRSDDGHAEMMQERTRLRDRSEKKEGDRESLNRSKRRRSERFSVKNEKDAEEDSSDESLGFEEASISQNSPSFRKNFIRRSFPPASVPRHETAKTRVDPSLKASDEMIGVSVPRKARSACIKRAHDCRTSSGSGGGGFGEDHWRPPASAASFSFEAASPSSSTVSVKQKTNANGSISRFPKPLKSSGATEDDLEFEIAEVLSELKKQPRCSKKEDASENSLKSFELKVSKKIKTESDGSSADLENGSDTYTVRTENGHSGNIEISMAKPEKSSGSNPESHHTPGNDAAQASSLAKDTQYEAQKQEQLGSPDGVMGRKRLDWQDSKATKGLSEGPQSKGGREEGNTNKLEIDLMVPPPMASPERGRGSLPLASGPKSIPPDYNKLLGSEKSKEMVTEKTDLSPDGIKEKGVGNRDWLKLDLEQPSQDNVRDSGLRLHNQGQSQQQQDNSVLPWPIAVGGWPNGFPPLGYVPGLHTMKPIDGICESSLKMQAAPFAASQPRPKRCATHFFIARNIQLHQQFVKTNPAWLPNPASVAPATASEGLHGNPSLHGGFPILNMNSLAQDKGRMAGNVPTQKEKASGSGISAETAQKKPHLPPASSNIMPAPAFIFPISHHQKPGMGAATQSAPSKSIGSTKNRSLATGSASVSFSYPSSPASEASPYLTVMPNNGYTFQMSTPPAVRGGTSSHALPFFNGALYSPQMFQPQLVQKQGQAHKETTTSSGSSSSHRQVGGSSHLSLANVQKQHMQSSAYQSQKPEIKTRGDNSSLVSDCRGSQTQKSSYSQNMTVPVQPLNFSMSFAPFGGTNAPTSLNFTSNGYPLVHAPQAAQQINQQPSDAKPRGCSVNPQDPKRAVLGKAPPRTNGQTLVFDNSARTLNFVTGTWPSRAVTAPTMNSNHPASSQKHHIPHQQQQQQQSGRSKLIGANTMPAASLAVKFPKGVSVFPQIHSQANPVPAKSAQWPINATSSPLTSCTSLNLKQFQSQQQIRPQGQTQISFAAAPQPMLGQPSKGQQERLSSSNPQYQASPSPVAGCDPHGKTSTTVSYKTGPASTISVSGAQPQQQMEKNQASGSSLKSSPVCGRNMPSIISSCSGHLSELK